MSYFLKEKREDDVVMFLGDFERCLIFYIVVAVAVADDDRFGRYLDLE